MSNGGKIWQLLGVIRVLLIILGVSYRPEQLTKVVWDYIFFGGDPPDCDIPKESLL